MGNMTFWEWLRGMAILLLITAAIVGVVWLIDYIAPVKQPHKTEEQIRYEQDLQEEEDHRNDLISEYDALCEEYDDLAEEKESVEYAYNNALDVIGYYVGKYGEFDGYDERDILADGYYIDYRSGEEGIVPHLGGDINSN